MMRAHLLAVASALISVACDAGSVRPLSETSPQIVAARRALDDTLIDYPGSRFRNMHQVTEADGKLVLCGEVNGRNRMGGMTGWNPIAISTDGSGNVVTVTGGWHGISDFTPLCPYGTSTAGFTVDPTDVTPLIEPRPVG